MCESPNPPGKTDSKLYYLPNIRCSSCLNSQRQCSWCPYDGLCTANDSLSCDGELAGNVSSYIVILLTTIPNS